MLSQLTFSISGYYGMIDKGTVVDKRNFYNSCILHKRDYLTIQNECISITKQRCLIRFRYSTVFTEGYAEYIETGVELSLVFGGAGMPSPQSSSLESMENLETTPRAISNAPSSPAKRRVIMMSEGKSSRRGIA